MAIVKSGVASYGRSIVIVKQLTTCDSCDKEKECVCIDSSCSPYELIEGKDPFEYSEYGPGCICFECIQKLYS